MGRSLCEFTCFSIYYFLYLNFVFSKEIRSEYFPRRFEMDNKVYSLGVLDEIHGMRKIKCVSRCGKNENCNLVSFNRDSNQCRLYDHNSAGSVNQKGWQSWGAASCGTPDPVFNAAVTFTSTTYKSTAIYSCDIGYSFQGTSQEAVCVETGQWTGFSGSCDLVSCGVPGNVANGEVTYTTMTYNSSATYTCHAGYHFQNIGQDFVVSCQTNGQWSSLPGSCVVSCGVPGNVANGEVTYATMTFNSSAKYTCHAGYHFQNIGQDFVVSCQTNGQWSSLPGSCDEIQDCSDILKADGAATNGVYVINPTVGTGKVNVYCDMTYNDGGWTVIQRRTDGSQYFSLYWADYKNGFGNLINEFWLGNINIYRITNQRNYEIRFDLTDFSGNKRYALYSQFHIKDERQNFMLQVSGYSGDAGDSFANFHNGMDFSTRDNDNDLWINNCAFNRLGGWWYRDCHESNLNGEYNNNVYSNGINWYHFRGFYYSLKYTTMKIRPT